MQNVGPLFEKIFQGFYNRLSSFQRKKLRKSDFFFEKVLSFWYHFWRLSNFFVFLQIALVRCVKTPISVPREKKLGETNIENCFSINFGLWAEKNLDFQWNSKAWFSKL